MTPVSTSTVFFVTLVTCLYSFSSSAELSNVDSPSSRTSGQTAAKKEITFTAQSDKKSSFRGYLAFMLLCGELIDLIRVNWNAIVFIVEPDLYCIPIEAKTDIIKCFESGHSLAALYLYRQCTAQGTVTCDDQPMSRTVKNCLRLQSGVGNLITDASRQCIREKVTLGHLDCYKINSKLRERGQQYWGQRRPLPSANPSIALLFTTTTAGYNYRSNYPVTPAPPLGPVGGQQGQAPAPAFQTFPTNLGGQHHIGDGHGHGQYAPYNHPTQQFAFPFYPQLPQFDKFSSNQNVGHSNRGQGSDVKYASSSNNQRQPQNQNRPLADYDDEYEYEDEPSTTRRQRRPTTPESVPFRTRTGPLSRTRSRPPATSTTKRRIILHTRKPTTTTTASNTEPAEAVEPEEPGTDYDDKPANDSTDS